MLRANVFGTEGPRRGKGFGLEELKAAGIDPASKGLKLAIDRRRKTKHEKNVELLRFLQKESEGKTFKKSKTKKNKGPVAQPG